MLSGYREDFLAKKPFIIYYNLLLIICFLFLFFEHAQFWCSVPIWGRNMTEKWCSIVLPKDRKVII